MWMIGEIKSFVGTALKIKVTGIEPDSVGQPTSWSFAIQGVIDSGGDKTSDDQLELDVTMTNGSISSVSLKPGSYPSNTGGTVTGSFPNGFLVTNFTPYWAS